MTSDQATKRPALLIATLASFLTPFMVSSINVPIIAGLVLPGLGFALFSALCVGGIFASLATGKVR
jgi:hypothetical protein